MGTPVGAPHQPRWGRRGAPRKELVRVIDPRASVPILSQVLLQATAGILSLTATDLKRILSCRLPAGV